MSPSRTLTVAIARPPADVYEFASNPANLPRWATAFCKSVRQQAGAWIMETPQGPVKIRFVPRNDLGVLDHYVEPAPGPLDWESDRRGETEVAVDRVVEGKGEQEQSSATIVEDRPQDRPGGDKEGDR